MAKALRTSYGRLDEEEPYARGVRDLKYTLDQGLLTRAEYDNKRAGIVERF